MTEPPFPLDLTTEQHLCRDRYGFWLAEGGPDGEWYLYVPAGTHADGSTLTQARRAGPWEAAAWLDGDYDAIARGLVSEGVLVSREPKRQRWARLRRLWQKVRGQ